VAVEGGSRGQEGEAGEAVLDFTVHHLKGDLYPDLVDYMWGGGCPKGVTIPVAVSRKRHTPRVWSIAAKLARPSVLAVCVAIGVGYICSVRKRGQWRA
jgi:hypothetical protein